MTEQERGGLDNEVTRPAYYGGAEDPYEPIKVIEAWKLNFHLGCVVKYVRRFDQKGGLKDLVKARWYLNRQIEQMEKENG